MQINEKTARFCTFAEKWRTYSSERDFFSKHVGLIHLAGLRVLKHFFGFVHLFIISPLFHLSSCSSLLFSSLLLSFLVSPLHLVSSHVVLLLSSCPLSSLLSTFSSLVFNLLFHLHVSLLLSFIFSFLPFHRLVSSLLLSRLLFSCLVFSFLFFSCLVSSSLFLSSLFFSCLVLSLFLCLPLSLSVSLCLSLFLSVSVSVSLCLSPCGVVCCGVVWCVWCPRVYVQKRLRVYVQNVPVCTGTTRTCVTTCGRGAGTYGDVLNLHTKEPLGSFSCSV